MKTIQQQETEAILSMVELIKTLEQQLSIAKARIKELEDNQKQSNFAELKSHITDDNNMSSMGIISVGNRLSSV